MSHERGMNTKGFSLYIVFNSFVVDIELIFIKLLFREFENILLNPALTACSERNAVEDEWVLCLRNKWVQQEMAELCYCVLQQLLTLNESALSCSRVVLFILFTLPILLVLHPAYFLILLNLMFWIMYLLHYYFFVSAYE